MSQLPIVNIHTEKNQIFLFLRRNRNLIIQRDFYKQYYYEETPTGIYQTITGKRVKKILCREPFDASRNKSDKTYENDLSLSKRYLIDKITDITKSDVKYLFIDTEQLTPRLPNFRNPIYPMSCISSYDNYSEKIQTWFLLDYEGSIEEQEKKLLGDFLVYMKEQKADLWCLSKGTLVNKGLGQELIENLKEGEYLTSYYYNHITKSRIVHKRIIKKQTYKIITRSGILEATQEHLHPTLNFTLKHDRDSFIINKKTPELNTEDYLLMPINFLSDSGWRDNYYWLMGYYFGDGSLSNRLEIKDANREILEFAKTVLYTIGLKNISLKKYNNYYTIYSSDKKAFELLEKFKQIRRDGIVNFLQKLSTEQQLSFIGGFIDAEGTYSKKFGNLSFCNTNKTLIDFIRHILFGVGIVSSEHIMPDSLNKHNRKISYIIHIVLSQNNQKLYINHPNKKIWTTKKYRYFRKDIIPIRSFIKLLYKNQHREIPQKYRFIHSYHKNFISRRAAIELLNNLLEYPNTTYYQTLYKELLVFVNNFHFEKIKKIEDFKDQEVVELVLDKSPYFIANNFLTHNCSWNVNYDWNYTYKRLERVLGLNLAEEISPIKKTRRGIKEENIFYPAGTSILDYMGMFEKVNNKESSYALDEIAQKYLKEPSWKQTDFNKLTPEIKEKNIHDVERMIAIEKRFKLIPYFDESRRTAQCLFEDTLLNSRIIDQIVLKEAKNKSIILPTKKYGEELDNIESHLEGAYRKSLLGRFEQVYYLDVSGDYPGQILNYCLDISNLRDEEGLNIVKIPITDRETRTIKKYVYMYQNENAIMPHTVKKLLGRKAELKNLVKITDPNSNDYKDLKTTYDAYKGLVNSAFGVVALKIFRLFNIDVASCITSLARDLMYFIEEKCLANDIKILFIDTDSVACIAKENPLDLFNQWIQEWGQKYGKDKIDLEFAFEGIFKTILLTGNCHYIGYLQKESGEEKVTKGVELKKRNSNAYIKEFQGKLFDMVLDNKSKEECITYILSEWKRIEGLGIDDISFPAKIAEQEYKVETAFIRAVRLTKEINPKFNIEFGNNFRWIYIKSIGQETKKGKQKEKEVDIKKEKNVIAYTNECKDHLSRVEIDWVEMKKLNILNKVMSIFFAMGWILGETDNQKMKSLKLLLGLAEPKLIKVKKEKVIKPKKVKVQNKEFLEALKNEKII